jgi:hypothetical protein
MPKKYRRFFLPLFFFLLLILSSPFIKSAHAQTPTIGYFTRNPWPHPFLYPCNRDTGGDPEFHPLRPYPGNPCDPLIPRKDPEAQLSDDPVKQFLTYKCSKSFNVEGTTRVKDVINICGMDVLPANPLSVPLDANGRSEDYLCSSGSTEICFVKRIIWDVAVDLSNTELPFSGNTQYPVADPVKVNAYLSWYLNGTIFQSEKLPLNGYLPTDTRRITTYSGPLNRLYPKDFQEGIKYTMTTAGVNSDYHNYLVACQRNIDFAYIRDALTAVLQAVFGNIFDIAHFVGILLSEGIDNLSHVGEALVQVARLPADRFNIAGARTIFLDLGLSVIGNDAGVLSELLQLGRNVMSRIGNIASALRLDLAESCTTSGTRWRLSNTASDFDNQAWIRKYVPYSTLEDTTSEFTLTVIPTAQPIDIDGQILSIGLTIDIPTDSRLYFPHLRAALALSEMTNAMHKPILTPTPGLSSGDRGLVRQRVTLHQGIDDSTLVQGEDRSNPGTGVYDMNRVRQLYSQGRLIRNTEMREGQPAPTPLYIPSDVLCDIRETKTNKADQLLGKEVNGTLTYYQLFRYTPQLAIGCGNCPGSGACIDRPSQCQALENETCNDGGSIFLRCCWGDCPDLPSGECNNNHSIPGYCDYITCSGTDDASCTASNSTCCYWNQPSVQCPAWPERDLRSAARMNPFTKTPFVDKLYDLLVLGPQSMLKRWLPKMPEIATSSWEIKAGREDTIPASTMAQYTGSTQNLDNQRVTAGRGGSGVLYFPFLGSTADHILGQPTNENLNLQRMLRPKGFVGSLTASMSGDINCNTNLPEQNAPCVNRDNFIDVAERWTSMPEGTHAEMCFNDVVFRANEAGVNPGLSLLIWLNESDASNYLWRTPVEDFGVHVGQYNTPNNFDQQITGHLLTVQAIRSRCASEINTYGGVRVFAAIYLVGNSCVPNAASDLYALGDGTAQNPGLIGKWNWIGGGCDFPFP